MHTAAEMLLFEISTFIYDSNRGTDRNLNTVNRNWPFPTEQHKWEMLKRVVERAWPNHPERRLSDQPITRDNHYYFRRTYLNNMSIIEYLEKKTTRVSLEAADFIGLLNPEAGSISRADPTQVLAGDGTSFKPLYGPRQDIESHFSTYKRQLNYDRLRTVDKYSLMFNWLAHDLFQINTALVAYHRRTGKDVSRWFGNHFSNTRAGPLEKAA